MREGQIIAHELAARAGITPAYAGRTLGLLGLVVFFWDHPRLCGKD